LEANQTGVAHVARAPGVRASRASAGLDFGPSQPPNPNRPRFLLVHRPNRRLGVQTRPNIRMLSWHVQSLHSICTVGSPAGTLGASDMVYKGIILVH